MLDDVLWSRVQQLSPKDRELIELLAVSGQPLRVRDAYASARDPHVDPQMIARMRAEHSCAAPGLACPTKSISFTTAFVKV